MSERELFLKWLNEKYVDFNTFDITFNEPENRFNHMPTEARWEAWQASANRKGYKLVPVEPTKEMLEKVETEKEFLFHVSSDYCDLGIPSGTASEIYKAMIGAVE